MGRQPFGLASAAAWLREAGADVLMQDLAVSHFEAESARRADLIAFYVPMHTATRLALPVLERVQDLNPRAEICFYGLYAPMNEKFLRSKGVDQIVGPEFEHALVGIYRDLITDKEGQNNQGPMESLERPRFITPDRVGLLPPEKYAALLSGQTSRKVGYTEATRGCRHRCLHCPVVPVYGGRFVVAPVEVVLEDVQQQVALGAEHITFGDPDFFNGPAHARRVIMRLHENFPDITYDVTIKVEHLLAHADLISTLRDTGCVLVTSAIESFDDEVLVALKKGHTGSDIEQLVTIMRDEGIALNPTFVAFTPWTTRQNYLAFLSSIARLQLVDAIAPVQYAIRLLVVADSGLLSRPDISSLVDDFDTTELAYPWVHPDPVIDDLQQILIRLVEEAQVAGRNRREIFELVWKASHNALGNSWVPVPEFAPDLATIPFFTEPWFC